MFLEACGLLRAVRDGDGRTAVANLLCVIPELQGESDNANDAGGKTKSLGHVCLQEGVAVEFRLNGETSRRLCPCPSFWLSPE